MTFDEAVEDVRAAWREFWTTVLDQAIDLWHYLWRDE